MAQYQFHTQNHVRIWFSRYPTVFLNDENQLRLVRFREKNPRARLTFLYSSSMLNELSIINLLAFCRKYHFNPYDFDTDLLNECIDQFDSDLHKLAKNELEAFSQNRGGNLAAASDITRLITRVLEKGTYSDFDTVIDVESLPEIININAAILFNIGSVKSIENGEIFTYSNDIIGVASENGEINKIAKEKLHSLQRKLISNYQQNVFTTLNESFLSNPSLLPISQLNGKFYILSKLQPATTVTDFRVFLDKSTSNIFGTLRITDFHTLTQEIDENLKIKLQNALLNLSNDDFPENFTAEEKLHIKTAWATVEKRLFKNAAENLVLLLLQPTEAAIIKSIYDKFKDINDPEEFHRHHVQLSARGARTQLLKESVTFFSGPHILESELAKMPSKIKETSFDGSNLFNNFHSNQTIRLESTPETLDKLYEIDHIGKRCAASWLPQGHEELKRREKKLHDAARTIQLMWKRHQSEKQNENVKIQLKLK